MSCGIAHDIVIGTRRDVVIYMHDAEVTCMATWIVAAILIAIAIVVFAALPTSPLKGVNRVIFIVGGLLIVIGYVLIGQGPASNPVSLSWAPLVLVIGYVVIIPIALLRRQGSEDIAGSNETTKSS